MTATAKTAATPATSTSEQLADPVSEQPQQSMDWRSAFGPILRNVAVPVGAYFALHAMGYSDFLSLLAGTVFSGVMIVVEAVRARRLDAFSVIMLCVFAFGLLTSLITGDPRMMIVKDSVGTMIVGGAFLVSILVNKPLTYVMAQKAMAASSPQRAAELEHAYRTNPQTRRSLRNLTAMWGFGLLGEAVLRAVLAYQLPVSTMMWLSTVLMIAVVAPLVAINIHVAKRARRTIG